MTRLGDTAVRQNLSVAALLFDMDGTLVDSTVAVERIWREWCAEHGVDFPTLMATAHGRRSQDTIERFIESGVDAATASVEFTAREMSAADGVRPIRGAHDLLTSLPEDRWTIVTSASRRLAELRLEQAGLKIPQTMVTADDVEHGKPAPDGYLLAARRLGIEPSDCLVLEDAMLGHEAARRAGMASLNVMSVPHASSHPTAWLDDLSQLVVSIGAGGMSVAIDSVLPAFPRRRLPDRPRS